MHLDAQSRSKETRLSGGRDVFTVRFASADSLDVYAGGMSIRHPYMQGLLPHYRWRTREAPASIQAIAQTVFAKSPGSSSPGTASPGTETTCRSAHVRRLPFLHAIPSGGAPALRNDTTRV